MIGQGVEAEEEEGGVGVFSQSSVIKRWWEWRWGVFACHHTGGAAAH